MKHVLIKHTSHIFQEIHTRFYVASMISVLCVVCSFWYAYFVIPFVWMVFFPRIIDLVTFLAIFLLTLSIHVQLWGLGFNVETMSEYAFILLMNGVLCAIFITAVRAE